VDRVRVVYEGVDTRFAPAPADRVAAVRTRYWLPQEYLLFVGTVEPKKNVRGLVEAYRRLVARDNQIPPLVIAGRLGWMFEGVLQQVSEPKLQGRVRFLGPVPDDDLPALLSGASVFVFPSLYEGFGLPVLEAMACGVPVITSRISALPEVVGEAGLLVDPLKPDEISAAITLVLQDPRRAALMRERGLARAKEFSWEETARKTWQIYCEAIS
jgi:glycosyltransferase involved in cell wall biosynthesis